jgi:hypothetical protein
MDGTLLDSTAAVTAAYIDSALRESALGVSASTARKRDIIAAAVAIEKHILERATMSEHSRAYGLDLLSRREFEYLGDDETTTDESLPRFDAEDARRLLLTTRGFWAHAVNQSLLADLAPHLRDALVLAVRGALTREDPATRIGMLKALARRRGADRSQALERAMRSSAWSRFDRAHRAFLTL